MSKGEVLTAHETTIESAARVTAEQLRLATHIVRDHVHNLDEATHHALVAAVVQALATNFLALRTG
jgi:hypothetical protein